MPSTLNRNEYITLVQGGEDLNRPAPLAAETSYRHDSRRCAECQQHRSGLEWQDTFTLGLALALMAGLWVFLGWLGGF